MTPHRVLVVDDEPIARAGLAALIAADSDLEVAGFAGDGPSAVHSILRLRPDIVVLDVQLPEFDGFEVLRRTQGAVAPAVVFVTAYDSYALRAFDVSAIDYVLKPFSDERFLVALAKAKSGRPGSNAELDRRLQQLLGQQRRPAEVSEATEDAPRLTRIAIRERGRTIFVNVSDIDWIEADDYYACLHTRGKVHLVRETMNALEMRLDPARFYRVHRSAIVNLDRVKELQTAYRGEYAVLLLDGSKVGLTQSRKVHLEALLSQRI